jgi:hypothetical protein
MHKPTQALRPANPVGTLTESKRVSSIAWQPSGMNGVQRIGDHVAHTCALVAAELEEQAAVAFAGSDAQ